MRLIYACYGGAHSSPVAAAIHMGWLSEEKVPTADELLEIPRFDRTQSDDHGIPEFIGRDDQGHDVYVLGRGPGGSVVEKAFYSGYLLAGGDGNDVVVISTLTCVNVAMRIGGFLSRGVKATAIGRPIVLWGTRRAYNDLVQLVRATKRQLSRDLPVGKDSPSSVQNAPS